MSGEVHDESRYTSDVAQTVDAASNFIRNNNPILICFIICISVFCGLFYYQSTIDQQRTKDLIGAINHADDDQKSALLDLKSQLQIMNDHLSNIEKQTYKR